MNVKGFLTELKRRNVLKVAIAYIVAGWALSQGIAQVFPVFDVPNWAIRSLVVLVIVGLPVAVLFAWFFELTSEGIKRTEVADTVPAFAKSRKYVWIYVVVIGVAVSIGLFFLGRYTAAPRQSQAATVSLPAKSIAVLPFDNQNRDPDTDYLSDGIPESIINSLSQLPNLKVMSRNSVFHYKGKDTDAQAVAKELKVQAVRSDP